MDNLQEAIVRTVEEQVFFGSNLLQLETSLTNDAAYCDTAMTDGTNLIVNTDFLDGLKRKERVGLVCHEVLHVVMEDHLRRGDRWPYGWNVAADIVNNAILKEAGVALPPGGLLDPRFDNQTKEVVYAALFADRNEDGTKKGEPNNGEPIDGDEQITAPIQRVDGSSKPVTMAEAKELENVKDATNEDGSPLDAKEIEEAAQKVREEIYIGAEITGAKLAGDSPDFVKRLIEHVERSFTIDWQEQLADFFKKLSKPAGSDWSKPHRKRYAAGFYSPSRKRKPALGHIAVGVDISGSMNEDALKAVEGQLQAMFEDTKPERVTVFYCNTKVVDVDDFHGHEVEDFKFAGHRGGGTRFDPVFEAVSREGDTPDALIYFTDGYGQTHIAEPDYPVLWATTAATRFDWGNVVRVTA